MEIESISIEEYCVTLIAVELWGSVTAGVFNTMSKGVIIQLGPEPERFSTYLARTGLAVFCICMVGKIYQIMVALITYCRGVRREVDMVLDMLVEVFLWNESFPTV